MIISKTPFRVSLFGGSTDYKEYYEQHGGEVLGFTINKFCWITLRKLPPFFDYRHRLVYSEIELVKSAAEIRHPVVRAALEFCAPPYGIELHHDGDLPARAGLGSSSSFTVGLLNALHAFRGHTVTRSVLAGEATHLERDILGENVGSQDQAWAAYGGLNNIEFHRDGSMVVSPLLMPIARREAFQDNLMLFFTGFSRYASVIAGEQIANFDKRQDQLKRIRGLVTEARSVLESDRWLGQIGAMLDETWAMKRSLAAGVSTPEIDEIYAEAKAAGALGGKLLGAGGGGFLLLYVPRAAQNAVRERLHKLINVQFRICNDGSRVVLYEPDGL